MSSPPPQEFGKQGEEGEKGQEEEAKEDDATNDDEGGRDEGAVLVPKPKRGYKRRRIGEKVDQSKVVDIKSLPANPLQDVPFQKQSALQVKAFVGNKVYVANTGDKDVTIPVGTFLCGYGKGRFARNINGSFNPDCHHMYTIKTCDDFVFTSKIAAVKDVVADQRSNNPEAKIAYHSMFDIASKDKDAFGVKQDHEVFFIPAFSSDEDGGQSQQITQGTLAGKLPANTFESSHCVVQTWGVKWGPQGLSPVRPLVLFKQSCDLPAGKALSLM
jgi:hypothetical protein